MPNAERRRFRVYATPVGDVGIGAAELADENILFIPLSFESGNAESELYHARVQT